MELSLQGVGHVFSAGTGFAVRALSGIDFAIQRGELAVVVGPTGSGKSTLLRVASGLLEPTEGVVRVGGRPLTGPVEGRAAHVGLVFQAPETQLFAETVLDDVAFGPGNLGFTADEATARAREALVAVGLDPDVFGDRSPFALSGGEARRVAIAGVVAMRPSFLLLDEPTAGLDAAGRTAVSGAIDAARADAGVVVVTHEPSEFLGRADTVLVLRDGGSVYRGTARGLIDDPSPLDGAGLEIPAILKIQLEARRRGLDLGSFSMEPEQAARALLAAYGAGEQR